MKVFYFFFLLPEVPLFEKVELLLLFPKKLHFCDTSQKHPLYFCYSPKHLPMEKRIGIRPGKETLYFEDEEYICFKSDGRNAWAYVEYKEGDQRYEGLKWTDKDLDKEKGWLRLFDTRHLKCFEKLGKDKGLLRSHKEWVVNTKRVYARTTRYIKVRNAPKDVLPIGPKFRKTFKTAIESQP